VLLELFLAHFLHFNEGVNLRDLQHATVDEFLNGLNAGSSIGTAEGLVVAGRRQTMGKRRPCRMRHQREEGLTTCLDLTLIESKLAAL